MYRNNPVQWQKPIDSNGNKTNSSTKPSPKDVRKPKTKKDQ